MLKRVDVDKWKTRRTSSRGKYIPDHMANASLSLYSDNEGERLLRMLYRTSW